MLTYTMSEDGNTAHIGPCVGGRIRLSIVRLCKQQGREIPAEALDEATDLDSLRDLNLALLIRRNQLWRAQRDAEAERQRIEQAERERRLPAETAAAVAELRQRAEAIRERARYADRLADLQRELAEAAALEQRAYALATGQAEGAGRAARDRASA